MPRYRLVEDIPWSELDGSRVSVEVSSSYIILVKQDGTLVKIAKVMHPRRPADQTPTPRAKPTRLKAAEEG